jgi:hypothetical protein
MKTLGRYSFGVGDRFAHQAEAQLQAISQALQSGVEITPVWNKSYREHRITGSQSLTTRKAADSAVARLHWAGDYFVDADHVNLSNVDFFLDTCDFYTIDVADYIGCAGDESLITDFCKRNAAYIGRLEMPRFESTLMLHADDVRAAAEKYLFAVQEAGRIYRYIRDHCPDIEIIIEISMDESEAAQTPQEIFLILSAVALEGIPVQTIAPRFSGRFNKGIDYAGDLERFRFEFEQHLAVIGCAVLEFGLFPALKLSVHSGSDKFSIYPIIKAALAKYDAGIHVKTAGTTWLEELIGLAEAGGTGLELSRKIYAAASERFDELCGPYASVLDVDPEALPPAAEVQTWSGQDFALALRHVQSCPRYNPHMRQFMHVAFKVAAEQKREFLAALQQHQSTIARNVTENLFERHIKRLFL